MSKTFKFSHREVRELSINDYFESKDYDYFLVRLTVVSDIPYCRIRWAINNKEFPRLRYRTYYSMREALKVVRQLQMNKYLKGKE